MAQGLQWKCSLVVFSPFTPHSEQVRSPSESLVLLSVFAWCRPSLASGWLLDCRRDVRLWPTEIHAFHRKLYNPQYHKACASYVKAHNVCYRTGTSLLVTGVSDERLVNRRQRSHGKCIVCGRGNWPLHLRLWDGNVERLRTGDEVELLLGDEVSESDRHSTSISKSESSERFALRVRERWKQK